MRAWLPVVLATCLGASARAEDVSPWRVGRALCFPAWLELGLEHRSRGEVLANDFHPGAGRDSAAWLARTTLAARVRFEPLTAVLEVVDSRALATAATPLTTAHVDPLDLLQAHLRLGLHDVLAPGDGLAVTAGRLTVDFGSRRLLARNEFRNTINAFTGIDAAWTSAARHQVRLVAVVPVTRRPTAIEALRANLPELDVENGDAVLAGALYAAPPTGDGMRLEVSVLGLVERDAPGLPSADRRLVTPGLRLVRAPAPGRPDWDVEGFVQLGLSRATTAAGDTSDLAHLAWSAHATLGLQLPAPGTPRLALRWDFASGDEDPRDARQGRFDPLFGARRFDLGPTGLFGALARSNLHAPGLRAELSPLPALDVAAEWRAAFLASATDAWPAAGLRDATGASGTFLGHQLEARLRWRLLPGNLALEFAGAVLGGGDFAANATGARGGPSVWAGLQATATL